MKHSLEDSEKLFYKFMEYIDYARTLGNSPELIASLTISALLDIANYSYDDMRMFCEKAILAQVALEGANKATLQEEAN